MDMLQPTLLSAGAMPGGKFLVQPHEGVAAARFGERVSDCHLSLHRRVGGLELDGLHDLGIGHEPHEPAMERVGLRARLAGASGQLIGQRDPERATLACLELVDAARHLIGHHPILNRPGAEQGTVDTYARSADVSGNRVVLTGRE